MSKQDVTKCWNLFSAVSDRGEITRILLHGVPGTGKTTTACKIGDRFSGGHYSITLHEDSSVAELIGHWVPKPDGSFQWLDGIAVRAWVEGKMLVLNEVNLASGPVLTQLHNILDDPNIAQMDLPDGRHVTPKSGFRCVCTMNGSIEDLPAPVIDRFDLDIPISSPHPDALKMLPERLRLLVENSYSQPDPSVTFRQALAYQKLSKVIGEAAAADAIFGEERATDIRATLCLGEREGK